MRRPSWLRWPRWLDLEAIGTLAIEQDPEFEPTPEDPIAAWNAYWVAEGEWRLNPFGRERPVKPPRPQPRYPQTPQSPEDVDGATLARMATHKAGRTWGTANRNPEYDYWVDGLEVAEANDPHMMNMVADHERRMEERRLERWRSSRVKHQAAVLGTLRKIRDDRSPQHLRPLARHSRDLLVHLPKRWRR